jgi:hypothetical protein
MARRTRRLLVVSLAVVAVGGIAAGGVALAGRGSPDSDAADRSSTGATPAATSSIAAAPSDPTAPATATPTTAAVATSERPTAAPGATAQVTLVFAEWDAAGGRLEAGGFVADVIQSGGTCTLTASRNGIEVEATREGEADATTTSCGVLTLPGDRLGAGDWQVTLSYRSATHGGSSRPLTATVPAR